MNNLAEAAVVASQSLADRREHDRVAGPFDGRRIAALDTPIRIYDLSRGGCFVNSLHEQQPGIVVILEIDLPGEGRITVKAETLYRKPGFGFAVRFIETTEETLTRLDRAIDRLRDRVPHDV